MSGSTRDQFDTIVIGAGQAGPGLAYSLASRGERIALIERDQVGGTCLNSGCRPTKAIRASARAAHVARTSAALGVHVADVRVDLAEVVARKDALIDGWRDDNEASLERDPGIELIGGDARFDGTTADGHRVAVVGRVVSARRVIVNTGARSVPPAIPGLDSVGWLDHHGILDLTEPPAHLVVIGGSYIGLEFAQIFRRFGSEVTVIEAGPRVIGREDPEFSEAITGFLTEEGIDILTSCPIDEVRTGTDAPIEVVVHDGEIVSGSHLLVAAGRIPNADDLGLDTVGVERDDRGYIVTDDLFATNVAGIYAVGDVNGRGAFTHTAYQDYEILADHLAGGERTVAGRVTTYALFTDPPLGRVGMTEREARDAGAGYLVTTYSMSSLTRAVLDGQTAGIVKLLVDATTGRFLGASILGLHGDELVQTIGVLMHAGIPASVFDTWLPIHPTVAEFLPTILRGLSAPDG
jgi:pyruvate/2-oxoglutarate dehydrogenase complex dihydrolipoamide dehydrogenase (E3) component